MTTSPQPDAWTPKDVREQARAAGAETAPEPAEPADDSYPSHWRPHWLDAQASDDVIFRGQ